MSTPRCSDDISRTRRAWDVFSESMIGKKPRNYRTAKVVHFIKACEQEQDIIKLLATNTGCGEQTSGPIAVVNCFNCPIKIAVTRRTKVLFFFQ